MPAIPAPLLRRVSRVRLRWDENDWTVDEAFDDVFVLWRAFESTLDKALEPGEAARAAVASGIEHSLRHADLHNGYAALAHFVDELKLLSRASAEALGRWLGDQGMTSVEAQGEMRRIQSVREAVTACRSDKRRWHRSNGEELGRVIYKFRCAIIHSSVETNDTVAVLLAPRYRDALIDLNVLRGAEMLGVSPAAAWQVFDADLVRLQSK